jgi:hypothetical protein
MSLEYVRRNNLVLASEVLARGVFVDELPDLTDSDLNRLIAECEVTTKCLQEDHDSLAESDENRIHVRHKRNIWKTYRQACLIEKQLRGVAAEEKFYILVAERLGSDEAKRLMELARG